jgi:hypothetical protein
MLFFQEESAYSLSKIALQVQRQLDGRGISTRKKRRVSRYDHERARAAVYADYLSPNSVFNDRQFERMFRISKTIMQQLIAVCAAADPFFTEQTDTTGRYKICPFAKILMALKVVAFGCSPMAFVDYFQMSDSTGRSSLLKFCKIVSNDESLNSVFRRNMTRSDARRVCQLHEKQHGVAGMIGSLDCMHICWKNCPVAWQGAQIGKSGMLFSSLLKRIACYSLRKSHIHCAADVFFRSLQVNLL